MPLGLEMGRVKFFLRMSVILLSGMASFSVQSCLFDNDSKNSTPPYVSRGYYAIAFTTIGPLPKSVKRMHYDSAYIIKWNRADSITSADVLIQLYKGDTLVMTIPKDSAVSGDSGAQLWNLGINRPPGGSGTNYRIKISSVSDTSEWDFSPTFAVYSNFSGSIRIQSPTISTVVQFGSILVISWTASGNLGSGLGLELYRSDTLLSQIGTYSSTSGFYYWTVAGPITSSANYRIRVFSLSDPALNARSPLFRITKPYYGSFTVTAPAAGAAFTAGNSSAISWTSSGTPGNTVNVQLFRDSTWVTGVAYGISSTTSTYYWIFPSGLATSSRYRIRIVSQQDTSIYAYSGFFTVNGIAPDAFEPDNQRGWANSIADTIPQSRTLTYLDTDWVRIDAEKGRAYSATLQAGFTFMVYVTDSSGNFLNSYSGANLQTAFTAAYTGRYYLRVQYYSSSSGYQGAYTLTVRSFIPQANFTAPSAGAILTAGSISSINWIPDVVVFGNMVSFRLYRDTALIQSMMFGVSNNGSYVWTPPSNLTTGNDYRIRIENYNNTRIFAYGPAFTINGLMPDSFETDNSRLTAKIILDSANQARTLTMADTDWVQFSAVAGRQYLFKIQSGFMLNVFFTDSNGTILGTYGWAGLQMVLTPANTGRHYLRIQNYSTGVGFQGPYSLSMREFDAQTGLPVTFTSPSSGATLAAGSTYNIGWVPDSAIYGATVNFSLYRDSTLIQTVISGTANDGISPWTIPTNSTTAGNYRLRISNYSNNQIFAYSPLFAISGINPDVYEPDNVRLSAKAISDSTTQARTMTLSDTDWVQFNAVSGRKYLAGIQSSFNVFAYVADSSGIIVSSNYGSNLQILFTPVYAGRYYLRIECFSNVLGYQGAYSLSLRSYDAQTGFPLSFSSPASGAVLTAGSTYPLNWTPDSLLFGTSVSFQLYRDSLLLQTLVTGTPNDGVHTWTVPSTLTSGNNYRIRIVKSNNLQVFASSPVFTINGITPDIYEPDNTRQTAMTIADSVTQSRTLTLSDTDWMQINTVMGNKYLATVMVGFPVQANLTDSNGNILNSYTGTSFQLTLTPTYAGRYYLRVMYASAAAGFQGSYHVTTHKADALNGFPITFTSPQSGAAVTAGSTYNIGWIRDTISFGSTVNFLLYRDTVQILSVSGLAANSGNYSWSVPSGLISAGNYRLRIASNSNAQVFGFSPVFSITGMVPDKFEPNDSSGVSTLLQPNQGREQLSLTLLDRDWFRFTGIAGRLYIIRTVSALSNTAALHSGLGGALITSSAKAADDSVNSIAWVCLQDGQYSFQVSAAASGSYSLEFQEFTSPRLAVTSPAAGDTVTRNQSLTIRWTSLADIRGLVDIFLYNSAGLVRNLAVNTANTGVFNWIVPLDSLAIPAGNNYEIRVISRVHSSISGSSGGFQISSRTCSGAACPPTLTLSDFESGNGGFVSTGINAWRWGAPTYNLGPSAAHSGNKVWGLSLDTSYANSANYELFSPSFTVPPAGTLAFWHWLFKESSCCDYGYVGISVDGGATFTNLATFSIGTTAGWAQASYSLASYSGQIAILRWRFTSDGNVNYPGWFIDDVEVR